MTPLALRRYRAMKCFAVRDDQNNVAHCEVCEGKEKVVFEDKEQAQKACAAVLLVDPTGDKVHPQKCRRNPDHYHVINVEKVQQRKRRRRKAVRQ